MLCCVYDRESVQHFFAHTLRCWSNSSWSSWHSTVATSAHDSHIQSSNSFCFMFRSGFDLVRYELVILVVFICLFFLFRQIAIQTTNQSQFNEVFDKSGVFEFGGVCFWIIFFFCFCQFLLNIYAPELRDDKGRKKRLHRLFDLSPWLLLLFLLSRVLVVLLIWQLQDRE